MRIAVNALESSRFGVTFARLDYDVFEREILAHLLAEADRDGVDVTSVRVDADTLAPMRDLEACGFRIMDTLVYYRTAPVRASWPADEKVTVDRAAVADADGCALVASQAFQDYLGHYHADPRLAPASADAAYVDWTRRLLSDPAEGQIALCTRVDGQVAGYLVGVRRDGGSEIVLNAVDPANQRRGCYGALLSAYLGLAADRGDREVTISTQLQNYRVQRAWHRHGLMPFAALHTLHRWRPGLFGDDGLGLTDPA